MIDAPGIFHAPTERNGYPTNPDAETRCAGADFGHTGPQLTFPVGGHGELCAADGAVRLPADKHWA